MNRKKAASSPWPGWMDFAAVSVSTACLVHCLLLPLLFAFLPALSLLIEVPENFHIMAFVLAVPASVLAMLAGYRHHGSVYPVAMAGAGLILIALGALGGLRYVLETGISVIGSVTLAAAHLSNWRLRRLARAAPVHGR